jgi:hypothetical protein
MTSIESGSSFVSADLPWVEGAADEFGRPLCHAARHSAQTPCLVAGALRKDRALNQNRIPFDKDGRGTAGRILG